MQDGVCKSLDLQLVEVSILAEYAVVLVVANGEAFYIASAQVPGIVRLANNAAVLTIHLETLVPVHTHGDGEVEVSYTAISELDCYEPAVRAKFLDEPGLQARDLAPEKTSGVNKVATVGEQVVMILIGFRVAFRSSGF